MPAVQTQLLADETDLAQMGVLASALSNLSSAIKLANLRRASGEVLAAYAKRFRRAPGSSFTLAVWGDFTKGLVIDIACFRMIVGPRGLNPSSPDGKILTDNYQRAMEILNEIADLENANARIDPDAVGSPDTDDMGPLGTSEGGPMNAADDFTRRGRCTRTGALGCC